MGFLVLGKLTISRLRAGVRICSRKRLFRNLRMSLLPIRAMRISRRAAATAESELSLMKRGSLTPSLCAAEVRGLRREKMRNPCAETARSLRWSIAQNPHAAKPPNLRTGRAPSRPRPQAAPSQPQPLSQLRPLPLQATPNLRNLSRPSSTFRCSASYIEVVMGGSCSSSTARPDISRLSTHRSWCRGKLFPNGLPVWTREQHRAPSTPCALAVFLLKTVLLVEACRISNIPSSFINRVLEISNY